MAQAVLSKGALGEPLTIHVGFTLGVMMAVYIAGGVSGKSSAQFQCHSISTPGVFTTPETRPIQYRFSCCVTVIWPSKQKLNLRDS